MAFDARSHFVQQVSEVHNLRLARSVLEDAFAVGECSCHHQVFGAGDGDLVEDDLRAFKAIATRFYIAVLLGDVRPKALQALEVKVDGASPDSAAAWH